MVSPLRIAELARQSVQDAEQTILDSAWGNIESKIFNVLAANSPALTVNAERFHCQSIEEVHQKMDEVKALLVVDCQKLYERVRHRFVECFHLSAPEFEAQEQKITELKARLQLRNRQIRDLRRQARK